MTNNSVNNKIIVGKSPNKTRNDNQMEKKQNKIISNTNISLISTKKEINTDSLKKYTMEDMIHLIDDLIQENTNNQNGDNDDSTIKGDNTDNNKMEYTPTNSDKNDNPNYITNIILKMDEDGDEKNNYSKNKKETKDIIVNSINDQQSNEVEKEIKNDAPSIDINNTPFINKDTIFNKNEKDLERTSIESIYHMKVHLKAWYLLIVNDNYKCKTFQEKKNWKLKNYIFSSWMKNFKKSKNQRELMEEAENYKKEQIKMIKATKFWMQNTKSKCFAAWTIFSQIKKQENQIKEQHKHRVQKMNEFLSIAKQRLQEKQNQEEELKINHLTKIINQDKDMSEKLSKITKEITASNINKLSLMESPTISSSSNTLKISNKTNIPTTTVNKNKSISNVKKSRTTSSMRNFKATKPRITKADIKFCEEMEKRNQAILERKRQSEQRRKEREEKLRKQKEEEERKREEERKLEIKRERQRKLEEKKKAKMEQIEKEKQREKFLRDVAKAKKHYQQYLLSRYGLQPWKKYSLMVKKDKQESQKFYQNELKKQFFVIWHNKILEKQKENEYLAITYHKKKCLKKYFSIYFDVYQGHLAVQENCDEFYLMNLIVSSWKCWIRQHRKKQEEEMQKQKVLEEVADNYAKSYVPKRFLRKWIAYYRNKKDEQWREYRKELLRGKVKEWLSHSNLNTQTIPQ
ncbi:hypothetical protein BCR36DRAFT_325390 [Piromyces finnis]|uniref:Sfi1 spindle body domain-containing protein n=1 Tax=Piromyces finnis TaxID=1754191 RepID=A0A1Y1VBM0_9FUNG|nr:hypothetical protein BCR36DRAFT_325390 [Piromyces finnis]|eukprot:ORX51855.1 hypothetical protein BCR36DRAFT_325390 [Piromyces finnis]